MTQRGQKAAEVCPQRDRVRHGAQALREDGSCPYCGTQVVARLRRHVPARIGRALALVQYEGAWELRERGGA